MLDCETSSRPTRTRATGWDQRTNGSPRPACELLIPPPSRLGCLSLTPAQTIPSMFSAAPLLWMQRASGARIDSRKPEPPFSCSVCDDHGPSLPYQPCRLRRGAVPGRETLLHPLPGHRRHPVACIVLSPMLATKQPPSRSGVGHLDRDRPLYRRALVEGRGGPLPA